MSLIAYCFSSESRPKMEIKNFPNQRDLSGLSYSENASSVSVKNLQDMEINNKVEIEASMQFRNKTLLRTWLHVAGTCSFILWRMVAMSRLR